MALQIKCTFGFWFTLPVNNTEAQFGGSWKCPPTDVVVVVDVKVWVVVAVSIEVEPVTVVVVAKMVVELEPVVVTDFVVVWVFVHGE